MRPTHLQSYSRKDETGDALADRSDIKKRTAGGYSSLAERNASAGMTPGLWAEILRDYDGRHCCDCEDDIGWFQKQPSLRAAIEVAALAKDARGRRYSHQYRIRRQTLEHARAALLAGEVQFTRARSFDAVLAIVTQQLREVRGSGELYRYDTAFRIGAYLRRYPTRVYLHAGTRAGARLLHLEFKKEALEMSEVPVALRRRKPHEVEDILCIYKSWFSGDRRPGFGCAAKPKRRGCC